jgi:mRNA-degrading endonuclease RelE of RelBE toxin-antitoxin system
MLWEIHVARRAQKELERAPPRDRERIIAALQAMRENPFGGDLARLKNQPAAWRRRVGDWRIFFDLYPDRQVIHVTDLRRRTSTTYRKT